MYVRGSTPYLSPNAFLLSRICSLTWNIYAVPFKPKVQGICSLWVLHLFLCVPEYLPRSCLTDSTISGTHQILSKRDLDNLWTPSSSQIPWPQCVPQDLGTGLKALLMVFPSARFPSGTWMWFWSVIPRPNTCFYLLQPLIMTLGYRSLCPVPACSCSWTARLILLQPSLFGSSILQDGSCNPQPSLPLPAFTAWILNLACISFSLTWGAVV